MRLPFSKLFHSSYSRITLNRTTTLFFVFSFIHCFTQGIIQSFLFSIDTEYNSILSPITTANIPSINMTVCDGSPGNWRLRICNDVPSHRPYPCSDIFRSAVDTHNNLVADRQMVLDGDNLVITPSSNFTVVVSSGSKSVSLSLQCTQTLLYSEQFMHNWQREDLTFVFLQFWLFGISVFAIMTDSVPHTLTVLITRVIITAWAAYAVWRTNYYKSQFTEIIFNPGTPCSFNIYPTYFQLRVSYEIPDLILNVTALLIACRLSIKLLRDYSAQSLKCVGAPTHINRIHKFFMAVLACLQLEGFALAAATALWLDVIVNTALAKISAHNLIYKGLIVLTIILLLPWIAMGWYAIKNEMKRLMIVYLGIAFFLLTSWSLMFYSIVYRWEFLNWPYLGCFTVASLILIVASLVLGVICRLNFGKGLAQYLRAEAALASVDFAPEVFKHDEEKASLDLDIKVPATFREPDEGFNSASTVSKWNDTLQKLRPVETIYVTSARSA
ncbi:hypothetical protein E4T56_gene10267 [Termitomyces sp. T112]|nr:hypothetical protein E4T56_gene10267 [Termitomyces sp. T112]